MENKTPYSEIFLAVEEAFGKTPTNGEIDDFVTELSKRGIVLTKFYPLSNEPEGDKSTKVITSKGPGSRSIVFEKSDFYHFSRNFGKQEFDSIQWCYLPTAPKSENNS